MAYVPPHRRRAAANNTSGKSDDERIPPSRPFRGYSTAKGESVETRTDVSENEERAAFFCHAFTRICCINLRDRPDKWRRFQRQVRRIRGLEHRVERFNAILGSKVMMDQKNNTDDNGDGNNHTERLGSDIVLDWDTTKNAEWDRHIDPGIRTLSPGEVGCALSHVALWRELAVSTPLNHSTSETSMLILEDDAAFVNENSLTMGRSKNEANKFLLAFEHVWTLLTNSKEWDMLYLGFSDRGERLDVMSSNHIETSNGTFSVQIFRPSYGFHTHCYALTKRGAKRLIQELPVTGPVDVWLADNQWFGLNVFCAIIANEGWKNKGKTLVHQDRSDHNQSDIQQSGRY